MGFKMKNKQLSGEYKMSVSKKSLENLKQPSKKKSEFAKAKTGMKYLTAETIREALSKNNNLLDSLEEATIR